MERSDSVMVAVRPANEGAKVSAERRTGLKRNPESQSTHRAQNRPSVSQAADRIRQFAQREPQARFATLLQTGACRATSSSRMYIPKQDRGTRSLGIADLDDKIVRKAVAETKLVPIDEARLLGFSHGFNDTRGRASE